MKVLVTGGLNLSVLDGWWDEAFTPPAGWAIGDGVRREPAEEDAADAEQVYRVIERSVVPEFYARSAQGLPVDWLERVRASMGTLTPRFSANRMVREYVETAYTPAARRFRERSGDHACAARELARWAARIDRRWSDVAVGAPTVVHTGDGYRVSAVVTLGALDPAMVRVELYADALDSGQGIRIPMDRETALERDGDARYTAFVPTTRPASHYTPRVVPFHPLACVPAEAACIRWAP
jgi:starch phosphorylase